MGHTVDLDMTPLVAAAGGHEDGLHGDALVLVTSPGASPSLPISLLLSPASDLGLEETASQHKPRLKHSLSVGHFTERSLSFLSPSGVPATDSSSRGLSCYLHREGPGRSASSLSSHSRQRPGCKARPAEGVGQMMCLIEDAAQLLAWLRGGASRPLRNLEVTV